MTSSNSIKDRASYHIKLRNDSKIAYSATKQCNLSARATLLSFYSKTSIPSSTPKARPPSLSKVLTTLSASAFKFSSALLACDLIHSSTLIALSGLVNPVFCKAAQMFRFSLSGDAVKIISTSTAVHGICDLRPPIFEGERGTCFGVPGASGMRCIEPFVGEKVARGGLAEGGLELGG
jgi:hypothetical protein